MHSDIVIADVSFPNPNVFYELGVRHACRVGTVMIKDRAVNGAPFDIAHQRHIAYDNTPSGLKELAKQFRQYFEHFDNNPHKPDNQLLELASLTNYAFPNYKKVALVDHYVEYALAMINFPEVMEIFATRNIRQIANFDELVKKILLNPDKIMSLLNALHKTGDLAEVLSQIPTQNMLPNILQEEDKMSPSNVPRFRKKK